MNIWPILRQKRWLVAVIAVAVSAVLALLATLCPYSRINPFRREFSPTDWTKSSDVPSDALRIRVVDAHGSPVEGAFVGEILEGNYSSTNRYDGESPETRRKAQRIDFPNGEYSLLCFKIRAFPPPRSSRDGVIDIPKEPLSVSHPKWQRGRPQVLYVLHPGRRIGGLACYRARDLGSVAELTLRRLCPVRGTIARADGKSFFSAQTFAFWGPLRPWWLMPVNQGGRPAAVNMLLPPGSYTLRTAYLEEDEGGVMWCVGDTKKVELREDAETLQVDMILKRSKRPATIVEN
jgi:hypothetical protein